MAIKNVQGLKSIRQINRLIAGYKEYGKEFFIHGNRGRKSKHAISIELKDTIEGFKAIVNGDVDHIPEIMFSFKGTIDDVLKAYSESQK